MAAEPMLSIVQRSPYVPPLPWKVWKASSGSTTAKSTDDNPTAAMIGRHESDDRLHTARSGIICALASVYLYPPSQTAWRRRGRSGGDTRIGL
jgi:hypothetical protein